MSRSPRRHGSNARLDFTGPTGPSRPTGGGSPEPGRLRRTAARALLLAGIFGVLAGWLIVTTAGALDLTPPLVPWLAPIALWVAALVVGGLAWSARQRIQVRRVRMDPQWAVTLLALGKASALAGALVAGGYLAFGLLFLNRWDAELPRERVVHSGVAVLAGIALMVAGLLLERACEVPVDKDTERSGDRPEAGSGSDG